MGGKIGEGVTGVEALLRDWGGAIKMGVVAADGHVGVWDEVQECGMLLAGLGGS